MRRCPCEPCVRSILLFPPDIAMCTQPMCIRRASAQRPRQQHPKRQGTAGCSRARSPRSPLRCGGQLLRRLPQAAGQAAAGGPQRQRRHGGVAAGTRADQAAAAAARAATKPGIARACFGDVTRECRTLER